MSKRLAILTRPTTETGDPTMTTTTRERLFGTEAQAQAARRDLMIDYEISYEVDEDGYYGDPLAFNVRGHGHHPDVIDQFLDAMRGDGYADSGWDVREDWLRKVPHPDGGSRHTYGTPGRGARAVTVIERSRGWGYWCISHPYEPASVGHSASQVIDGEALVTRRLAELATEVDPRRDVARRQGMGGYVYMCRECSTSFGERLRAASATGAEPTGSANPASRYGLDQ